MEHNRSPAVGPGTAPVARANTIDESLVTRVRSEFAEIPGLSLSLAQASKLFDLEPSCCEQVMNLLVANGTLRQEDHQFRCVDGS